MRKITGTIALCLVCLECVGCPPNVQQHAGFEKAALSPNVIEAPVGEVVKFDVLPPVTKGTRWSLDASGLARFVGDDTGHLDWLADTTPIRMEAMVAPAPPRSRPHGIRGWLSFGLNEMGAIQWLDRDLPIRPLPYRELAPVTSAAVFSLEPRTERLSVRRTDNLVFVTYRTPVEDGTPFAPGVGGMLLETGGRKILYAEVKTNFGERTKERVGYDVTLSYPASVGNPVEVVVVEWLGHGLYYGPFSVYRMVVGETGAGAAPAAVTPTAPTPATAAPAPSH